METWLTKGPVVSLYLSGAAYSVGFVLFSFSSNQVITSISYYKNDYLISIQHIVTRVLTLFFAALYGVGLIHLYATFVAEKWNFRKLTKTGEGLITYRSALILVLEFLLSTQRSPGDIIDEDEDAKAWPAHNRGFQVSVGMQQRARSLPDLRIHLTMSTAPSLLYRRHSFSTSATPAEKRKGDLIHPPPLPYSRHSYLLHAKSENVREVLKDRMQYI